MMITLETSRSFRLLKVLPFLLFILTITYSHNLYAQDELSSRFLTVKDGLPQGFVSGIVQDKAGFIWVSTRNGLARYDGKKFKVFYHHPNDTTSLAGNIIRGIFLDSRNRLWINYESAGLDVFYPETEKISHISNHRGLEVLKDMGMELDGIQEDAHGALLFNTANHGLIKLNADSHPTLQFPLKNILSKEENIFGITQNKARHLFILTKKFLYELNENQEMLKKTAFTIPSFLRSTDNRYHLYFPSDTSLFISCSNVVVRYRMKDNKLNVASITSTVKPLWGFSNYSLTHPNSKEGVFTFANSSRPYTFSTNAVDNMTSLLDKTNVLWIGTSGYGIQLVYLLHNSFQYQKYTPPFTAFLIENYLHVPLNKIPKALATNDNPYNLRWTYDKTGKLWMCNVDSTNKWGLQLFVYTNNEFQRLEWHYINGERIKNDTTYGLAADSKNNIWVLTAGYLLHKLNPLTGIVQTFSPTLPRNIKVGEESLFIDKEDNFWITSNFGLLHYTEGDQSYSVTHISSKNGSDQEANRVINIAEDIHDENKLWMGTIGNGLFCFDKKDRKFTSYTTKEGLPDNTIYSVMADKKGYIWCSTNHGIFRFDTRTKKARKYSSENGAPDFEFNRFHNLRLPNGDFAFGGFHDYTVFDPTALGDDTAQPNVAITAWKINNRPADYLEEGSPLNQSVNSLTEVHLSYLENFLTFEFAALQYNQPELFEYRYKLSGVDKDWVYAGNNNSINYTALSPGDYTLFINAANASGIWSAKIKELRIIIDPPWWYTWWAFLIYAAIAAAIVFLLVRNRLGQLHLQHQIILKQKETVQMKQLDELKSRFFSNITHELRTPLSLIISPVEKQLHENSETYTPKLLKGVLKNAQHLLKLINQLLDMSKLEGGSMQLSLSRGNLVLFIEQLIDTFKPNAEAKQIQLSLNVAQMSEEYIFDSDKLEKIINNLLGNAFKFTPNEGSIAVELFTIEKLVSTHLILIIVKDTGIGIKEKNLPNIFNRFYQEDNSSTRKFAGTGIGLSLVDELVKLMNGTIAVESEEGKGSSFIVTLPLQTGYQRPDVSALVSQEILSQPITPYQSVSLATASETSTASDRAAPLILVTEDNNDLRNFIVECLHPLYRIITASNGEEGWQQAQSEIPDIIISDVMMPVMDGYEFCEKIRQTNTTNHIAFIMLTAKTAFESKMDGLRVGADDYLTKPFNVEELLLRISNLFKRQEKLRQLYQEQLQPDKPVPVVNEVQDAFLQSIYQAIEKHLDNEALDVEMLAGEVSVSRRTLNRKLSAVAGMSANEIIRKYRLKKAAELLQQGHSVSEAAYQTGFSTPSWFTQCFKEMYGQTPLNYTENYKMSQN